MHNTVEQFLLGLADSLPQPLAHELGSMSWQQRIFETTAGAQGQGTRLGFYSDGLALPQKIAVEKFIKSQLEKAYPQALPLAVVFSRREKGDTSNAGAPRPNSPHHPAQGATQASSPPQDPNDKRRPIPGVKNIVAVASGKGGVGKSTVSVNLAVALHNQGYRVGLLDADIYGPSIPMMLGVDDDPQVNSANKIIPPQRYGLKIMSFGFFAPPESAVIWRGPMIMKALQQFFYDVDWGDLDFLIIDLPPGTGDAQLTLVQSLPLAGAVVVTTPQNVALLDAVKGVVMFQKTQVPVLGVVENMAAFECPHCGQESLIFGEGGATKMGKRFDIPILGHVPLLPALREAGDGGAPLTTLPQHPIRMRFGAIAEQVVERLYALKDPSAMARSSKSGTAPSPVAPV